MAFVVACHRFLKHLSLCDLEVEAGRTLAGPLYRYLEGLGHINWPAPPSAACIVYFRRFGREQRGSGRDIVIDRSAHLQSTNVVI